jgi:hypothetical protein
MNFFSHATDRYSNYLDESQRTGLGVAYQQDFNSFGELFRKKTPEQKAFDKKIKAEEKGKKRMLQKPGKLRQKKQKQLQKRRKSQPPKQLKSQPAKQLKKQPAKQLKNEKHNNIFGNRNIIGSTDDWMQMLCLQLSQIKKIKG